MYLKSLRADGFRNLREVDITLEPGINVITGRNAQGKTNLLEAAFYLAGARSFRTRGDGELIGFDREAAFLTGVSVTAEDEKEIEARLIRGGRRRLLINGVRLSSASELSGALCCVLFRPEDLEIVRGGAAVRRRFMDMAISQLRPRYAAVLAEYERVLESKTRILRDREEKPSLLSALPDYSERLTRLGAELIAYRASWLSRLGGFAAAIHREVSGCGEDLGLRYRTVTGVSPEGRRAAEIYPALREHMERHREAELASGLCLSGPHKDELELTVNGTAARAFASQGQARTAALSLKLATRELCLADTGECPVMLLDDVLSELDPFRRDFVLNRVSGGQVLISCCEDELTRKTGGKLFTMEGGRMG